MRQAARAGIILTSAALAFQLAVANAADNDAGRDIYKTGCAVCHGQHGQPDVNNPVVEGLGVMPADFSDPLFNSREPAGDWEMVIKYGGHAMGLAEQMPAQEGALTDAEIANVTAYIKSMVDTSDYFSAPDRRILRSISTLVFESVKCTVVQSRFHCN